MKIRTSFVSNSSSTSFTCQHCGWRLIFGVDCWDEGNGECPLCTNVIIPIDEKYTWMRSKLGMSEEQIEEAIRAERSKENK
jgi:DNA-directed RNA polymerase subunit M/transcription elongation factor TFIIS